MYKLSEKIEIIGVNPYIPVSQTIVDKLHKDSGKNGPIAVKGTLNKKPFIQTIVKYQDIWRLYLNTPMRRATNLVVGDTAHFILEYDPKSRYAPMPKEFEVALSKSKVAKAAFETFAPSHRNEILRYLGSLKSKAALMRNIEKVMLQLENKANSADAPPYFRSVNTVR